MPSRLHGDVPPEHIKLEEELLEMEDFFDSKKDFYDSSLISKAYVCLAHDYYSIGADEKGSELIEKAESICPGYFKNEIVDHINEDFTYKVLVENLATNIVGIARSIAESIK